MKVVNIYGSPRNESISSQIGKEVLKGLNLELVSIKNYYLKDMDYKGCQGCLGCKMVSERCVLKDIEDADILILASGVYFGDVTSRMKTFIDRLYSFYVKEFLKKPGVIPLSRLKPGKVMIMVLSQGHPDREYFDDIFPKYDYMFIRQGFTDNKLYRFTGISPEKKNLEGVSLPSFKV